ncbi:MAG: RIO1 family regulatory kinase/ATPase [Thermoproteota archaeon]|nr:RIO1 family regulatory kinase/ATPase [Thermoproteota archaeon]
MLKLETEDFQILRAIEKQMSRHKYVPEEVISNVTNLPRQKTRHHLKHVHKHGLIQKWSGPYIGYALNTAGYDCLALQDLVKADVLEAFGKPLGVGKESDVYDALTPEGRRVAVKLHRLGRTSFRQTRRKRGYVTERRRVNWLYQAKLAAEKEFEALKLVYSVGVAVPEPISQNRHIIVMGMIEGAELFRYKEFPRPEKTLKEILLNVRKAYLKAGVVHADLSEYNVILQPNLHILIIDWPQYVKRNHPNAEQLLKRDIQNILKFFKHKRPLKTTFGEIFAYVKGEA